MLVRGTSVDRQLEEAIETDRLFHVRMSTLSPTPPTGQDIACTGFAEDGRFYFCNNDVGHRLVRASEHIFTLLADHLNIAVPVARPIQVENDILFGSMQPESLLSLPATRDIFATRSIDELGRPDSRMGSYLSRLLAYDFFIENVDRSAHNFVAHFDGGYRKILAIDFASSTLLMRPAIDVGMPESATAKFARIMKLRHGFDGDAALEMVGRIGNVPTSFMQSAMDKLPQGWLDESTAVRFLEFWGGEDRNERLARLEASIKNGSLY